MSYISSGGRMRLAASLIFAFILGAVLFAAMPAAFAQSGQRWETYRNERFGYSLSYPASVFAPQQIPDNGDGQTFLNADGKAKVVVYATLNDEGFSAQDYRKTILKEFGGYDQMDYSPSGKTWFVLSGYRGEAIYYQKVMFSCGNRVISALSITFPRAEKTFYEGLVEVMEDKFRPGQSCN